MNTVKSLKRQKTVADRLAGIEANLSTLQRQVASLTVIISKLSMNEVPVDQSAHPSEISKMLTKLSPREIEVIHLFAQLRECKKIANILGSEVQTVRNQLSSIRKKLGLTTRYELSELMTNLRPMVKNG